MVEKIGRSALHRNAEKEWEYEMERRKANLGVNKLTITELRDIRNSLIEFADFEERKRERNKMLEMEKKVEEAIRLKRKKTPTNLTIKDLNYLELFMRGYGMATEDERSYEIGERLRELGHSA